MNQGDVMFSTPDKDARTWAMVCHIAAFAGFLIPFGSIIGPLVVWLLKKESHPFVDEQGREAVNFQITILLLFVLAGFLCLLFIGFLLLPVIGIYALIMTIIGAVRSNDGISYRYPFTLRLL